MLKLKLELSDSWKYNYKIVNIFCILKTFYYAVSVNWALNLFYPED